jgi:hypothetical protein
LTAIAHGKFDFNLNRSIFGAGDDRDRYYQSIAREFLSAHNQLDRAFGDVIGVKPNRICGALFVARKGGSKYVDPFLARKNVFERPGRVSEYLGSLIVEMKFYRGLCHSLLRSAVEDVAAHFHATGNALGWVKEH